MSEMRKISYRDAVREAMVEEMRRDEKVFLMGEDIGVYDGAFGVSKGMIAEFGPERVRETPISEQAFVGAGVGAAITGMRPIVELMFSDFMTRSSTRQLRCTSCSLVRLMYLWLSVQQQVVVQEQLLSIHSRWNRCICMYLD